MFQMSNAQTTEKFKHSTLFPYPKSFPNLLLPLLFLAAEIFPPQHSNSKVDQIELKPGILFTLDFIGPKAE